MEGPARVTGQPSAHPPVFVGGIVVDDGMDHFSRRNLRLDRIEEADELLMAVTLHVAADDSAVEDVESREQRGGAVAFVVVRHRPSAARLHRQPRLGAVERLDLALLIDRQNDRMGGRIDVETNNVLELRRELRGGRQLEGSLNLLSQATGLRLIRACSSEIRDSSLSAKPRKVGSFPLQCVTIVLAQSILIYPAAANSVRGLMVLPL